MADDNQTTNGAAAGDQAQAPQFNIQRIFTKDISFESPNAPAIFTKEWKPEIKLDIDTSTNKLDENVYEVVLSVTVTATLGEETAFLCEVQQAGIFAIGEMPDQNKAHTTIMGLSLLFSSLAKFFSRNSSGFICLAPKMCPALKSLAARVSKIIASSLFINKVASCVLTSLIEEVNVEM